MDVIKLFLYAHFPESFEYLFGKVESVIQCDNYDPFFVEDVK